MKDIQNHGEFFSGENFYDFDSFLNFGNKFDPDVRVTKSTTSRPRLLPTVSKMSLSVPSRRSTTKSPISARTNTIKTNDDIPQPDDQYKRYHLDTLINGWYL